MTTNHISYFQNDYIVAKYLILALCLLGHLSLTAQKKVVETKDGSIMRGHVIEDNDEYVLLHLDIGDTLRIGYKNILDIVDDTKAYWRKRKKLETPRYHLTDGLFVNFSWGVPLSLAAGKRLGPNTHLGGQIFLLPQFNSSTFLGIAPYLRQYLTPDIHKSRLFLEAFAGVGFREGTNNFHSTPKGVPFLGGLSFGVHIPNRKKLRFYFALGAYTQYESFEIGINDPFNRSFTLSEWRFYPQTTFVGIQF